MGYLNSWEVTVQQRKGFPSEKKKMMLMPVETRKGIEVTGNKIYTKLLCLNDFLYSEFLCEDSSIPFNCFWCQVLFE